MYIYIMQGTTLAGKTEHGKRLAKEFNMTYISSGDIARSLMDEHTKSEFAQGKLSPHDEAIRRAIYFTISNTHSDVLLDGFPRNAAHVIDFVTWIHRVFAISRPKPKIVVIKLVVPMEVIVDRCEERGRDQFDTREIVMQRNMVYAQETEPALDFLSNHFGEQILLGLVGEIQKDIAYDAIVHELSAEGLLLNKNGNYV